MFSRLPARLLSKGLASIFFHSLPSGNLIMSDKISKQPITIKKYANRRLYNTATSSYVTLEDLSVMVKNDEDFNVYDAKTSEDITRSVLTQIIVEEENKTGQQNLLPTSFLRQLIGFYGDNMQWMVPKYLEHSMEMLTGNQDQIREYFKSTLGNMFPFGSTFEEMSKQNLSVFENTMKMLTPFSIPFGTTEGVCTSSCSNTQTSNTVTQPTVASQSQTVVSESQTVTPPASCPVSSSSTKTSTPTTTSTSTAAPVQPQSSASVTNLKPRTETNTATNTPMPNVASLASSTSTGADDMQEKIANLQRQLADLAKSRA